MKRARGYQCLKQTFRSQALWVAMLGFFQSGCGEGEPERSLSPASPSLGIQNPDISQSQLNIELRSRLSADGRESFALSVLLPDNRAGGNPWSSEELLGDVFQIRIGSFAPIDVAVDSSTNLFKLSDNFVIDASEFLALHSAEIQIFRRGAGQALAQSFQSPKPLQTYPTSRPPLTQRYLSNCDPNEGTGFSTLKWENDSNQDFVIQFWAQNQLVHEVSRLRDTRRFTLNAEVFSKVFGQDEIARLEREADSDFREIKVVMIRQSPLYSMILQTAPSSSLRALVKTVEEADYRLEYIGGGCL